MTWKGWIICALVSIGIGFWLADFMSPENRHRAAAKMMAESWSEIERLADEYERLSDHRDQLRQRLHDLDRGDAPDDH